MQTVPKAKTSLWASVSLVSFPADCNAEVTAAHIKPLGEGQRGKLENLGHMGTAILPAWATWTTA